VGKRIYLAEAAVPATDLPPPGAGGLGAVGGGFSPGLIAGLGALGVAGIAAASGGGQSSPPAPAPVVADAAPVFTSAATASFAENATGTVHTAAASPDLSGQAMTYSLEAGIGDNDLFAIDAGSGTFSFRNIPDFENLLDAGGNNVYDLRITATEAGNALAASQDVAVTVTDVVEAPPAMYTLSGSINGVSVEGWKLIHPTTVNVAGTDKTFYYLDASGDGTSAGADWVTHTTLDYLFNANSTPGNPVDTTDTNRSSTALIPGKTVLLPTAPEIYRDWLQDNQDYPANLAEIWDANNSGYQTDGRPAGWANFDYWSATRSGSDDHVGVSLYDGYVDGHDDGYNGYVAFQVL